MTCSGGRGRPSRRVSSPFLHGNGSNPVEPNNAVGYDRNPPIGRSPSAPRGRQSCSGSISPMKFLCENCKAKYQIADDKVAGRTVRMKCRKCNHMIEVEASVTETSVAATNPTDDRPKPAASS